MLPINIIFFKVIVIFLIFIIIFFYHKLIKLDGSYNFNRLFFFFFWFETGFLYLDIVFYEKKKNASVTGFMILESSFLR